MSRGLGQACQISDEEYMEWPNCGTHFNVTTTNPSFYSWVWDSMGNPHGPVHVWLGGTLDCGNVYKTLSNLVGNDISEVFAYLGLGHRKKLWYSGIWTCEEEEKVSVDVKPSEVRRQAVAEIWYMSMTINDRSSFLVVHTLLTGQSDRPPPILGSAILPKYDPKYVSLVKVAAIFFIWLLRHWGGAAGRRS